jgi:predicted RNA methylase
MFCLSKLSLQVVEIGCGTGCAGLAAAALGAEAVLRPNTMSVVVVSDLCHSKYCTNLYEPYG